MPTPDDRRAATLLLGLALAGLAVRIVLAGPEPPGAVGFRQTDATRPAQDSVAARAARLARPLATGERIDVDRASVEDLTRLPRVGPGIANRIVAHRDAHGPFGTLDGLDRVPGIGPVLLEAVSRHVTFSGRPRANLGPGAHPRPLSLNRATAEELAELPGIGAAKAAAIVAFRRRHGPFRNMDDLAKVSGIGSRTVEGLRERVRIP
jgi:competence ComEA-like helix-hairpin-helix protein